MDQRRQENSMQDHPTVGVVLAADSLRRARGDEWVTYSERYANDLPGGANNASALKTNKTIQVPSIDTEKAD